MILDTHGVIVGCDAGSERLFAAAHRELVGRHISMLVPKLTATPSAGDWLSPTILFLSHCDTPFRTRRVDGTPFISALYFFQFTQDDESRIAVTVRDVSPQARGEQDSQRVTDAEWCLE